MKTIRYLFITLLLPISQSLFAQAPPPGSGHDERNFTFTIYLEGIYNETTHQMNKAQNDVGNQFAGTIADQITVELHPSDNYGLPSFIYTNVNLHQNGTCIFTGPGTGTYYLTVKHRNHLETVSATAINFGTTSSYSFNSAADKALGSNQKLLESGVYGVYGGDVNGDGAVNVSDISTIQAKVQTISYGFLLEDVNGDGLVNVSDISKCQTNAQSIVQSVTP